MITARTTEVEVDLGHPHPVEELGVGDLVLALESTQAAVGYGLRMLPTAGLVTNRRAGRVVDDRLADDDG